MSIEAAQSEIIEEFSLFDDWMDRYQYLIDLGRKLPPLAPGEMTDDKLLDGCQSRVWLLSEGDANRLVFRANSDAAIVSGLIALVLRVYSARSARDIVEAEPRFINEIGLSEHLSPTRANGLNAMLGEIRRRAQVMIEQSA
ncbi:MAG: SufE family protein [Pseudomonadota bacterium]|nr:MAG: SufE family protein [Pseudomonadota bacterium]